MAIRFTFAPDSPFADAAAATDSMTVRPPTTPEGYLSRASYCNKWMNRSRLASVDSCKGGDGVLKKGRRVRGSWAKPQTSSRASPLVWVRGIWSDTLRNLTNFLIWHWQSPFPPFCTHLQISSYRLNWRAGDRIPRICPKSTLLVMSAGM